MRPDWFKIMFLWLDRNTELLRAVDVKMARTKRIYYLVVKVNNLFFFSSSRCLLKEIENMVSFFSIELQKHLCEVWENSKKL